MKLSSLIEKELIITGSNAVTKEEAVRQAVRLLIDRNKLHLRKDEVVNEIFQREELGGTVFKTGLAIPHARLKDYDDIAIAVVIPKEPILESGIHIKCFVIMLTSIAVSSLYLQILAHTHEAFLR